MIYSNIFAKILALIYMETTQKIPKHVAIIMDGNRRWAKERGLPTLMGHKKGAETVKKIVTHAGNLGVKVVTVYSFSTENWNRPAEEVSYLMNLFVEWIDGYLPEIKSKGICFRFIGKEDDLPDKVLARLKKAAEETKDNKNLIFNLAINYGGRDELVRAVKKIADRGEAAKISEEMISANLDTAGLPDPDLVIRTSGEQRLSGFLLWQSAYSELYFPSVYWPDFDEREFDKAIEEYNHRQRRFGK